MSEGWVGCDLDSTLAYYDQWRGEEHIGAPIPAMVERVKGWLAAGIEVRILTARISDLNNAERVRAAIDAWCLEHIGQTLRVTNQKDYQMLELWDDRAVQVEANTGALIGYSTRGL